MKSTLPLFNYQPKQPYLHKICIKALAFDQNNIAYIIVYNMTISWQIPTKLGMNIPAVQKLPLDTQVINVDFGVEKDRGFYGWTILAYSWCYTEPQ